MKFFNEVKEALLHLAFPHICPGCGTDVISADQMICLQCLDALPLTNFQLYEDNPVAALFTGRVEIEHAAALYYFTKDSLMQNLMHEFKYRGNKDLGAYLGRLMGNALKELPQFAEVDVLVPLPLHKKRQRKRGYNQAAILCEAIGTCLKRPVLDQVVQRTVHTESQTNKSRIERWENMSGIFELTDINVLAGKHVLLIDDVITTGATLEACARTLMQSPGTKISLASLAVSSGN